MFILGMVDSFMTRNIGRVFNFPFFAIHFTNRGDLCMTMTIMEMIFRRIAQKQLSNCSPFCLFALCFKSMFWSQKGDIDTFIIHINKFHNGLFKIKFQRFLYNYK